MNWDRITGTWRQLKGIARQANEKRLAEWITRQHEIDPIHK